MRKPADDTGKIARSAGTVGIAVMCSRVLGLVREQAFAVIMWSRCDVSDHKSPNLAELL